MAILHMLTSRHPDNAFLSQVVVSYPNIYNPFVTFEPDFPSKFPYTSSLNPAAMDLLTDVHIIKLEGGGWDSRREKGFLYVQANFSYVAPTNDPNKPEQSFTAACVQFALNESRYALFHMT